MFFVLYFKSIQHQAAGMNSLDPNSSELLGEDPVILLHVSTLLFESPSAASPGPATEPGDGARRGRQRGPQPDLGTISKEQKP